jgi:hypothetical protein
MLKVFNRRSGKRSFFSVGFHLRGVEANAAAKGSYERQLAGMDYCSPNV